jgi:hypothetical protein
MALKEFYDGLQAVSWAAAAGAACFGVYKYFPEAKEKRAWEKTKLGKQMVDELAANTKAIEATYMLGAWSGRRYERTENGTPVSFTVTQEQVIAVLEPLREPQTANEQYVRECFDEFFYHLDLCVAAADRKIIDWDDIRPLFITLFAGIRRPMLVPLERYAMHSRYLRAASKVSELVEATLTQAGGA